MKSKFSELKKVFSFVRSNCVDAEHGYSSRYLENK
jgi:hypothetical protein